MKRALVIGSGIIGLSIAFYLKKRDFEVVLLDKGKAGMEASYAAAGMLAAQSEFDEYESFMDLCIQSRNMYESFCNDIVKISGIDVGYQSCGMIRPALDENQVTQLKNILEWQRKKRFEIEFMSGDELRILEPHLSSKVISGLYLSEDALVNNRKLIKSLIAANKCLNNKIIENKEVTEYIFKDKKIMGVKTQDNETLNSDFVINTAGAWSSSIGKNLFPGFKVKPVLGQMVSLHLHGKPLKKVIFANTGNMVNYVVPRDNEIVIGSTMEEVGFNKFTSEEKISNMLENAYKLIPELKSFKIKEKWSGFRPYSDDMLPIIGKTPIQGLLLATAHGRNGILLAAITAKAIGELIANDVIIPEIKDYGVDRFSNQIL